MFEKELQETVDFGVVVEKIPTKHLKYHITGIIVSWLLLVFGFVVNDGFFLLVALWLLGVILVAATVEGGSFETSITFVQNNDPDEMGAGEIDHSIGYR